MSSHAHYGSYCYLWNDLGEGGDSECRTKYEFVFYLLLTRWCSLIDMLYFC